MSFQKYVLDGIQYALFHVGTQEYQYVLGQKPFDRRSGCPGHTNVIITLLICLLRSYETARDRTGHGQSAAEQDLPGALEPFLHHDGVACAPGYGSIDEPAIF